MSFANERVIIDMCALCEEADKSTTFKSSYNLLAPLDPACLGAVSVTLLQFANTRVNDKLTAIIKTDQGFVCEVPITMIQIVE